LLKKHEIKFYVGTNPDIKCAVVERFNRTLKSRIWKYFSEKNTYKYLDVLKDIVNGYNHSYHRSIKLRPVDVTKENEMEVWETLYGKGPHKAVRFKLQVGDKVRLAKKKSEFAKGYYPTYTDEIFVIDRKKQTDKPIYFLKDLHGDDIYGFCYENELQQVGKKFVNDVDVNSKI
jgi:hypothetical protein